jgi:hypothetical protein
MMTVTTVDRSRGSDSIAQVNASVWLMNSVIVVPRYDRGAAAVTVCAATGDFLPCALPCDGLLSAGWQNRGMPGANR